MVEGQEVETETQTATINSESESKEIPNENEGIDIERLMQEFSQIKKTNERLLEESKRNKDKYISLRDEVDSKRAKNLEESENWKELLEIEKTKNFETVEQMNDLKGKVFKANLMSQVTMFAKDAYDASDVLSSLSREFLKKDDETLSIAGVKEAVEDVRRRKPHLFNTGVKSHGMGQEPPANYKQEKRESTLEELLGLGVEQNII